MFIDRYEELAFLNRLLTRKQPGPAQMALLYGRRRVGKTELLKHWAQQSGLPFTYWAADKEPAALQRRSFMSTMLDMPEEQSAAFDSWPALWRWLAPRQAERADKQILILDELSYASAADPALLSALQHAWDHHLKDSNLVLVLCGSQVTTMEAIMQHQSPLFGRFTGQWHLQPLPFSSLREFFPGWSAEERVALYGVVGGIPAYLLWLDNDLTLVDNIRQVILEPGNIFLAEPELLLHDELRDLSTYQAILRAISKGHHTLKAISNDCLIGSSGLTFHLSKLQELHMVERRLPATLTTAQQRKSKQGRYHLSDPFFRFYFRFLFPHLSSLMSAEETTAHIKNELRAFVGLSFEKLAQQWVVAQARAGNLPFAPEAVGSHWSRRVQVDVVAINHQSREILLGECKWGAGKVNRQVVRELIEQKGPKVRQELPDGEAWSFHYAVFARAGFTEAAATELSAREGLLVDLAALDEVLSA
ncbi:MAG: ATP-binding protein [Chloroflexi bacterium]|nr:ATP-binding protein [Chloroflexota bacterium]